jgi:hypothetical protein
MLAKPGVDDNLDAAGAICEHAGEVQRRRCLAGAAFLIAYRDYPGPRVPVEGVVGHGGQATRHHRNLPRTKFGSTGLVLTRTCQYWEDWCMAKAQQDVTISPRLITAIDRTWAAIQQLHPDVPDVVITLGAGSGGKAGLKLGHFAAGRWQRADVRLPELFIGGEGLAKGQGHEVNA